MGNASFVSGAYAFIKSVIASKKRKTFGLPFNQINPATFLKTFVFPFGLPVKLYAAIAKSQLQQLIKKQNPVHDRVFAFWWILRDLNPRPSDYESDALTN